MPASVVGTIAPDITSGPGWLIDMLALTRRRLHGRAEIQAP
jgi:hypothetical protein